MRKYAIDDIAMGILSIVVPVVIVLSIGYCAAEKKERGVEFVKVDSNLADKSILCATRIHTLEQEVDQLRNRVEDVEECLGLHVYDDSSQGLTAKQGGE